MKRILLLIALSILWLPTISCSATPTLKFKIPGLKGEILENVTSRLQLRQTTIDKSNIEVINSFYQEAPEEIKQSLKLYGYFKPSITIYKPTHKKNSWESIVNINLGPPLKISKVELKVLGKGKDNLKIIKHLRSFPLQEGNIFEVNKYNSAKQFLFDLADRYGYIKAFLTAKKILIDQKNNSAEITLHFDTGQRYYFSNTTFNQQFLSTHFLKKFLPYKSGDVYSSKKIRQLQESFNNSNLFSKVDIKPKIPENNSKKVPVDINLSTQKSRQYNFGAGYGTDTGFRGLAGMEARYLTHMGHCFKGQVRASETQNNLDLHYLIPGKRPATDLYDFNLSGETLDLDHGKSSSAQAGIGYITSLKRWQRTMRLAVQHERYKLDELPYQDTTFLLSNVNWLYTKKDNFIRPNKGYSINVKLQGGLNFDASSDHFMQLKIDAKYMNTFFSRSQIICRGSFGFTAIDNIDNLPLSQQIYAGGTQSIRGYKYDSIGPGTNLAIGSIELRQKIYGDWYFATFLDGGNVSNDLMIKPKLGAGAGIVWRTSIGALALSYAKAINQPGTPGMIQFSMGPEL